MNQLEICSSRQRVDEQVQTKTAISSEIRKPPSRTSRHVQLTQVLDEFLPTHKDIKLFEIITQH